MAKTLKLTGVGIYRNRTFGVPVLKGQVIKVSDETSETLLSDDYSYTDADDQSVPWFTEADEGEKVDHDFSKEKKEAAEVSVKVAVESTAETAVVADAATKKQGQRRTPRAGK